MAAPHRAFADQAHSPSPYTAPDVAYTREGGRVQVHDDDVERVRALLIANTSTGGCVDCAASFCCPCVPVAQIASSRGGSYARYLIAYALLYLAGLQLLVLAMRAYVGDAFAIQHLAFALVAEFVFFVLGPYLALPVASLLLLLLEVCAAVDEDPSARDRLPPHVYLFVSGDLVLDLAFACAAQREVAKLRRHVHVPARSCLRDCGATCCIWGTLGNASASAKQYARHGHAYLGPLDTIPAYEHAP